MKFATLTAAATVALLSTTAAQAATFVGTFDVSGPAFTDPGLVVEVDPDPGAFSFDLEVGDSVTFDLFDVWTDETWVNGDDTVEQDIFVAFDFTAPPPPFSGTVSGDTDGVFAGSWIFNKQYGTIEWDGPETIAFGPNADGVLELSLSDEIFNKGFYGLKEGEKYGATVELTATYVIAPSPVPLPASAVLLLAGLGGLGVARRFRKV